MMRIFSALPFWWACFFLLFSTSSFASSNASPPEEVGKPSMRESRAQEIELYIDNIRKKHGMLKMADISARFRPLYPTGKMVYGNTVQVLNLDNISLSSMDFRNCNFAMTSFRGATLQDVDFSRSDLAHVDFEKATLTRVNFEGANLSNAIFLKATLTEPNFEGANLFDAEFDHVKGMEKPAVRKLKQKTYIFRQLPRVPLAPTK